MKHFALTLSSLMLISPGISATEPAPARESLIATERAFAARAAATGNRTAFLEVLADDSVVFHPDPVNGRVWWTARPERKAKLLWAPDFVVVASSGELGLSTGPWIFIDEKGTEVAAGRFTSIWKREGGGPWKLLLDHGIGFERRAGSPWEPATVGGEAIAPPAINDTVPAVDPQQLDQRLTHDSWLAALAPGARVQRDGQAPGGDLRWAAARSRAARWAPLGGGTSRDSAFAFSYGHYALTPVHPGEPEETGVYIHVWRRTAEGWKLILQQFNPADAK